MFLSGERELRVAHSTIFLMSLFYDLFLIFFFFENIFYPLFIFLMDSSCFFLVDSQESLEYSGYQLFAILCITPLFMFCLLFSWSSNKMDIGLPGSCILSFTSQFSALYLFLIHFRITPHLHISIH